MAGGVHNILFMQFMWSPLGNESMESTQSSWWLAQKRINTWAAFFSACQNASKRIKYVSKCIALPGTFSFDLTGFLFFSAFLSAPQLPCNAALFVVADLFDCRGCWVLSCAFRNGSCSDLFCRPLPKSFLLLYLMSVFSSIHVLAKIHNAPLTDHNTVHRVQTASKSGCQ